MATLLMTAASVLAYRSVEAGSDASKALEPHLQDGLRQVPTANDGNHYGDTD